MTTTRERALEAALRAILDATQVEAFDAGRYSSPEYVEALRAVEDAAEQARAALALPPSPQSALEAAAPDMLAALQGVVNGVKASGYYAPDAWPPSLDKPIFDALAAVAHATGREG